MGNPASEDWKLLLVDDDEDDYILTRDMLNQAAGRRFQLDWAPTYQVGLQRLQSDHYNAALIDYDLGARSGIELIREAASWGYPAPLILFTGRGSYEVDLEAMQAGASLYLSKGDMNPLMLERFIRYAVERKRIEQERAILLESIQDGLFGIDRNWCFTYLNPRAASVGGLEPEELVGKNIWQAYPQLLGTPLEEYYRQGMEQRTPLQFEWHGTLNPTWYSISVYPSAEGISVYWQDITGRKQAEETIQSLAKFPGENPYPILRVSAEGALLYANPASQELLDAWASAGTSPLPAFFQEMAHHNLETGARHSSEQQIGEKTFILTFVPIPEGSYVNVYGMDITSRIKMENALRELSSYLTEERNKLDAILASLPVGVWIADENGHFIQKNEMADSIWHGDAPLSENIEEYHQYETWHPHNGKPLEPDEYPMVKAQKTGQPVGPVEFQIRRFDGSEGTILVSAAPIHDGKGNTSGVVGINLDITEHKKMEQTLQEREQDISQLFDQMQEVFFTCEILRDETGRPVDIRYLEANHACLVLAEMKREQMVGHTHLELFPAGPTFETWLARFGQVAQTGEPDNFEQYAEASGLYFITSAYSPRSGQVAVLLTDITERKRAEEALRSSEERFNKIFNASPNAKAICRVEDRRIETVNPSFEKLFGYSREEVIGKTPQELNLVPNEELRAALLQQLIEQKGLWDFEVELQTKSGERRRGSLTVEVLSGRDENFVLMILKDISKG